MVLIMRVKGHVWLANLDKCCHSHCPRLHPFSMQFQVISVPLPFWIVWAVVVRAMGHIPFLAVLCFFSSDSILNCHSLIFLPFHYNLHYCDVLQPVLQPWFTKMAKKYTRVTCWQIRDVSKLQMGIGCIESYQTNCVEEKGFYRKAWISLSLSFTIYIYI